METRISVGGLTALNRGLKAVDDQAPKQLRLALNSAAQMLIDEARPQVPADTGAARRSMVARSTRTTARVAVGGRRAPYFPWLDFGGSGRRPGRPASRPYYPDGRYIYPTLARIRPRIERELQEAISAVIAGAGMQEG